MESELTESEAIAEDPDGSNADTLSETTPARELESNDVSDDYVNTETETER